MNRSFQSARQAFQEKLLNIVGQGLLPRLNEALTHPSYANETAAVDNQRLEFLGDAVLGLCVSEMLANNYPEADEGQLTRMRAALVNTEALARWGKSVELGACLALGRGAQEGGERMQTRVLADAVEALVAAVYEARGLPGARALVAAVVAEAMTMADTLGVRDSKSALQEAVQGRRLPAPVYRLVEISGPSHGQQCTVEVRVGEVVLGRGEGESKRIAERVAAEAVLARIARKDTSLPPALIIGARAGAPSSFPLQNKKKRNKSVAK